MMPLSIAIRPDKLYRADGSRARGAQRTDNMWSRTLALFDAFGITKRKNQLRAVYLSDEGYAALQRRAELLNVHANGLAAFIIESELREDRCAAGHDLTPDNVIKEADGGRRCRTCRREYFTSRNLIRRTRHAADRAETIAS